MCSKCRMPALHAALPVTRLEEEAALRCTNPECPAQALRNLVHFASRGAMDIDGMGPAVVRQLVEKGFVHNAADVYSLEKSQLLKLDKFKQKAADNLLNAIEASKGANLDRLIFGLGIRNIGAKAAPQPFRTLPYHGGADGGRGRGDKRHRGLWRRYGRKPAGFFRKGRNERPAGASAAGRSKHDIPRRGKTDIFLGKIFVVTGTLPSLSRAEAEELIVRNGGRASSSVSKKTSYVLAGEAAGSKPTKAQEPGTPILMKPGSCACWKKGRAA